VGKAGGALHTFEERRNSKKKRKGKAGLVRNKERGVDCFKCLVEGVEGCQGGVGSSASKTSVADMSNNGGPGNPGRQSLIIPALDVQRKWPRKEKLSWKPILLEAPVRAKNDAETIRAGAKKERRQRADPKQG